MKTGFGDTDGSREEAHLKSMMDIMVPVIERGVVLAAEYSKACGRDVILSEDVEYAMRYCAMRTVGQNIGSLYPETYNSDDSDEEFDTVDPMDCPMFVRYAGDDPKFLAVNEAYDTWHSWVPQSPMEQMLKNAINNNEYMGA